MTLILEDLHKTLGKDLHIDDVSIRFEPGHFNVLLGPVRSGKTSLIRLIAGLDQPTSGRVLLDDDDITDWPVKRRNVAVVYQEFVNYPALTVFENIASPLRVRRCKPAEVNRRVREIAALMRLDDFLERIPAELSGGQQQRVAIARALVKDADIVLMDEPLANLDYKLREELRRELPNLVSSLSTVVLYATTDPLEALLLGGYTAILHHGAVSQFGSTANVYNKPASEISAQIFSDPPLNLIDVRIADGNCALSDGRTLPIGSHMRSLESGAYRLGIRGEDLRFQSQGAAVVPFDAKVMLTEKTGSETIVHIETAGQQWVAVANGTLDVNSEQTVELYVDPEQVFVFDGHGQTVALPPYN